MVDSKKKSEVSRDANIKKVREKLLSAYVKIKKGQNGKEVHRDVFVAKSGYRRSVIAKGFNTYLELKQIGELRYRKSLPPSKRALLSEQSKKFDPTASKEECIDDIRKIASEITLGSITRNYYREHGLYSDSTWNAFFGTFQEFRRQAGLELTRHQHGLERKIAKHASHDHYQDYYDAEYAPYFKKYEKPHVLSGIKRIMIISDLHDKECDEFTLSVFIAECKRKQPDIIVLNGDIFDFYEFSRYTQDPREYDIQGRFQ